MFSGGEKNFLLNSVIGSSSSTTLPKHRNPRLRGDEFTPAKAGACFYRALRYQYIKVLCFIGGL